MTDSLTTQRVTVQVTGPAVWVPVFSAQANWQGVYAVAQQMAQQTLRDRWWKQQQPSAN